MMILTLDNLAHRYNCLPSQALAQGTTLDLYVLDVSARYSKYQQEQADGNAGATPKLSQEQMRAMIDRVKGANSGN